MTLHRQLLVLCVAALLLGAATDAQAEAAPSPRILVEALEMIAAASSLPAISGDGSTVVYEEDFDTLSEAAELRLTFVSVATGAVVEEVLLYRKDDDGRMLPFPADGRGTTLWRRAQTMNELLVAGGYRSLELVGRLPEAGPAGGELVGGGLRLRLPSPAGRYVVRDSGTGARLHVGVLARTTYFCGMESDTPSQRVPSILAAWHDPSTRTLILSYGHAYASCMCPDDISFMVVSLATP